MNPISSSLTTGRPSATETELLIIGAGPYGLATAAAAQAVGLQPVVVGEPMEFWRRNMPAGMLLRSSLDWHMDPEGRHTLAAYLVENRLAAGDFDPIPLELFIDYAQWFRATKGIEVQRTRVRDVHRSGGRLEATLENGYRLRAKAIVVAPGVERFTRLPSWVGRALPQERYSHTAHLGHPRRLAGARCLIVGGRQSAFETAALLAEAGAERVDVVHRQAAPRFTHADWGFVEPLVERTLRWPGWFRTLPAAQRSAIERRFWAEGRLKLEPWLTPRLARPEIRRWSHAPVTWCVERTDGTILATLSSGEILNVDYVILATGYRADLARLPYLAGVIEGVQIAGGFPMLDRSFQTSVQGLYFTGFAATREFGPFFGFLRGATAAATIITRALSEPATAANDGRDRRRAAA